jgi:hypothetical protein
VFQDPEADRGEYLKILAKEIDRQTGPACLKYKNASIEQNFVPIHSHCSAVDRAALSPLNPTSL